MTSGYCLAFCADDRADSHRSSANLYSSAFATASAIFNAASATALCWLVMVALPAAASSVSAVSFGPGTSNRSAIFSTACSAVGASPAVAAISAAIFSNTY